MWEKTQGKTVPLLGLNQFIPPTKDEAKEIMKSTKLPATAPSQQQQQFLPTIPLPWEGRSATTDLRNIEGLRVYPNDRPRVDFIMPSDAELRYRQQQPLSQYSSDPYGASAPPLVDFSNVYAPQAATTYNPYQSQQPISQQSFVNYVASQQSPYTPTLPPIEGGAMQQLRQAVNYGPTPQQQYYETPSPYKSNYGGGLQSSPVSVAGTSLFPTSSASDSIFEKEKHLNKMRQLRQTLSRTYL